MILATACAAAVFGAGAVFVSSMDSTGGDMGVTESAQHDNGTGAIATPTAQPYVYTDDNVEPRVRELLAASPGSAAQDESAAEGDARPSPFIKPTPPSQDRKAIGPPLPSCVLDATKRPTEQPIATDTGQYEGRPVGVVVLPDRADSQRVTVFLIDSSCAATTGPGEVLLERTVPRS